MSEKEIKEILDKIPLNVLEALGNLENGALNYYKAPRTIEVFKNTILDYITNLEQENERLNNIINELEKELRLGYTDLFEHELVNGRELIENILNYLKELKEGK